MNKLTEIKEDTSKNSRCQAKIIKKRIKKFKENVIYVTSNITKQKTAG